MRRKRRQIASSVLKTKRHATTCSLREAEVLEIANEVAMLVAPELDENIGIVSLDLAELLARLVRDLDARDATIRHLFVH